MQTFSSLVFWMNHLRPQLLHRGLFKNPLYHKNEWCDGKLSYIVLAEWSIIIIQYYYKEVDVMLFLLYFIHN